MKKLVVVVILSLVGASILLTLLGIPVFEVVYTSIREKPLTSAIIFGGCLGVFGILASILTPKEQGV
ncbi:MAG: hypothetical protein M0Q91_16120 [Methanoregula sp.]|jgi:uncharacterized membrane protein YdcZ (DUF606 family)|nr:hypothetical protein [Methanoregula sp.]